MVSARTKGKETILKQPERSRPLTLDRARPLNAFRNLAVATAICVAFATA
jgi:hypothetical protein